MKKLYRKGKVHPTPPLISDSLSLLPATIFILTVALSPEDKEVLAYLISCSSTNFSANPRTPTAAASSTASRGGGGNRSGADHPPSFNCSCFRCYMSYWVKWDSSPSRQLIHEIIDAYEEDSFFKDKKEKNKERRRRRRKGSDGSAEFKGAEQSLGQEEVSSGSVCVEENPNSSGGGGGIGEEGGQGEQEFGKGPLRRFVNFLGEKIWGVWD